MTAEEIIVRVQGILLDLDEAYWTQVELLDYLNVAISALASVRPAAFIVVEPFELADGEVLQQIPENGIQFLGLTMQLAPAVRAITQIDKRHLDAIYPEWPSEEVTDQTDPPWIRHFMVYDNDPKFFYVFPRPADSQEFEVEIRYIGNPVRLEAIDDDLPVGEVYESALQNYVLSLAYSRNAKRGDITKADYYMKSSLNLLGIKDQAEKERYVKFTDPTAAI